MSVLHAHTLSIEGADAAAFAQAQLSSDIRKLGTGQWQWSAWLDPRGRVRALLNIARIAPEHFLLLLRGGDATSMAGTLQPYALRRQVHFTVHPVRTLLDAPALAMHEIVRDDAGLRLGTGSRSLHVGATEVSTDTDTTAAQTWRRDAIVHGHPWLPDAALNQISAPALDLQRLGGISLEKGCFPGQEIVARMHYRAGGGKQHLRHLHASTAVRPGTVLTWSGHAAVTVLDSVDNTDGSADLLAVVRDTLPHAKVDIHVGSTPAVLRTVNVFGVTSQAMDRPHPMKP